MSTTDVPGGQRRPSGEDPPLTRREMKERGISFTTELPAIDPADLVGAAAGAAHADRTEHDRVDAGRAVTGGGVPTGEDGAEPGEEEDGSERTAPTRRPVVRAPLTASGIRTVDESGTITSVQSAVGRAVEAATSPASWESAVSMPAVALGIQDVPVGPSRVASPGGSAETAGVQGEDEQEPERAGTGPEEPASTGEEGRAAETDDAAQAPSSPPTPTPEAATRAPQEVAEESVAPTPVRRGSRTTAVVVGVVLVVLIVVVLLVTLLSGGARAADLAPGVREGFGTLAVAPAFLPRRVPLPAEPTEEFCDR